MDSDVEEIIELDSDEEGNIIVLDQEYEETNQIQTGSEVTIIIDDNGVFNGCVVTPAINDIDAIEIIEDDDDDNNNNHNNDAENDNNGNTEIPPEPPDIVEFIDSSDNDDGEEEIHHTNGICELNELEDDLLIQQKTLHLNGETENEQHYPKGPMIIQCSGGVDLDTGRNEFSCDYCHQKFISKYDWEIHKRSHSSYKPYKCFICERIFHGNTRHLCYPADGQVYDEGQFNFQITEYILPNEQSTRNNINKDVTDNLSSSSIIVNNQPVNNQSYNLIENQTYNLIETQTYNSIEIQPNNSTENQPCDLTEHQPSDLTENQPYVQLYDANGKELWYRCRRCSAKFPDESRLEFHQQIHRYRCNLCGLACRSMNMLHKHVTKHQGPFDCDKCNKTYVRSYNLRRHKERAKHDPNYIGPPEVLCSICSKSFRKLTSLTKHMLTHDIKPHYCESCKLYFSDKSALQSHMLLHD